MCSSDLPSEVLTKGLRETSEGLVKIHHAIQETFNEYNILKTDDLEYLKTQAISLENLSKTNTQTLINFMSKYLHEIHGMIRVLKLALANLEAYIAEINESLATLKARQKNETLEERFQALQSLFDKK